MLTKTEAIVLHNIKYGETKIIVDMFTRQLGRLSFAVTLSRSQRGAMKKQYFQPLSMLTITFDYRPQQQLQKLSEVAILHPLSTMLYEPSKLSISLFLSEFLYHALKGEQENEPLFDYVTTALQWLDERDKGFVNFHLVFLMHLSRFLGFDYRGGDYRLQRGDYRLQREDYRLQTEDYRLKTTELRLQTEDFRQNEFFDLRAAVFCSAPPVHRDFLGSEETAMLRLMMRMDYHNMHLFRMTHQQRNRCVEVALQFYRLHLPDFPDLRALDVLRDLWE